jgi:hypothetical protein
MTVETMIVFYKLKNYCWKNSSLCKNSNKKKMHVRIAVVHIRKMHTKIISMWLVRVCNNVYVLSASKASMQLRKVCVCEQPMLRTR